MQDTVKESTNFPYKELQCKCGCGRAEMDPGFMRKIEDLRTAYGGPIYLSSAFRCQQHNAKVSHTGLKGPHTTGKSADVKICGEDAYRLVLLAFQLGFSGIGVGQRGLHDDRFIHLDGLSSPDFPRPRVWSY